MIGIGGVHFRRGDAKTSLTWFDRARPHLLEAPVLLAQLEVNRGLALLPGLRTRYAHLIYVKDLVRGLSQAAESKSTFGKTYFLAEDRAYANALRHQLRSRGVRSFGPKKTWGHYEREE